MSLSRQEKESFEANGFLLKKGLVSPEEIGRIRQELPDVHRRMSFEPPADVHVSWEDEDAPDERKIIRQLMHSELVSPTIDHILRSDALVDIVAELMHPQVALYHSKLLPKEAGVARRHPGIRTTPIGRRTKTGP